MTESAEAAKHRWQRWRAGRERFVTKPTGNLALEGTYWVTRAGQQFEGVPGHWSPLLEGSSGVAVACDDGAVLVDGAPVTGEQEVAGPISAEQSGLSFADGRTASLIVGSDMGMGGASALRVWNGAAQAIDGFGGIQAFDYDPGLVFEARVEYLDHTRLGVRHVREGDEEREEQIPAEFVFHREGVEHRLIALQEAAGLLVVFADATTGDTSYGVGRFLMFQPRRDGTVTLDFNRAYLPPCAFSSGFNCPLPPAQNRLPFAVTAGERNVLDVQGRVLPPASVPGWCR